MKLKKAPGGDIVTPNMIIELPVCAVDFTSKLFNGITKLGYFPKNTHMLLVSYLYHGVFAVRCNETTSNQYTIEAGVPQGSALGQFFVLH